MSSDFKLVQIVDQALGEARAGVVPGWFAGRMHAVPLWTIRN
jgi:hypothetical protein